jgi:hypothetical protein
LNNGYGTSSHRPAPDAEEPQTIDAQNPPSNNISSRTLLCNRVTGNDRYAFDILSVRGDGDSLHCGSGGTADALASGASPRKGVGVQIPASAPFDSASTLIEASLMAGRAPALPSRMVP